MENMSIHTKLSQIIRNHLSTQTGPYTLVLHFLQQVIFFFLKYFIFFILFSFGEKTKHFEIGSNYLIIVGIFLKKCFWYRSCSNGCCCLQNIQTDCFFLIVRLISTQSFNFIWQCVFRESLVNCLILCFLSLGDAKRRGDISTLGGKACFVGMKII